MARGQRGSAAAASLLDLAVVCGIVSVTYLAWLGDWPGPLRVGVGALAVLSVPGYALTALLFPARRTAGDSAARGSLRPLERLVCAVGLSLVSVPLVVLFLNYTPGGIDSQSVVASLCVVSLSITAAAAIRRLRVPPDERFRLPVGETLARAGGADRVDVVVAALFVCTIAVAGTAVATTGEQGVTEFYLLAEDDETGALMADDYPTAIAPNGSEPVYVGIENDEGKRLSYTVLVEFQRLGTVDGERVVRSRSELERLTTTLAHGESDRTGVRVSPPASATGERLRLTVLLYTGDVSGTPPIADAYRTTHVWVRVPGGGAP